MCLYISWRLSILAFTTIGPITLVFAIYSKYFLFIYLHSQPLGGLESLTKKSGHPWQKQMRLQQKQQVVISKISNVIHNRKYSNSSCFWSRAKRREKIQRGNQIVYVVFIKGPWHCTQSRYQGLICCCRYVPRISL